MYNCLIVDDEPNAHIVLKHYIAKDNSLQIVGTAFNAIDAQVILEQNNVDIVFLDINMPEITGLQMLQSNVIKACVILTTAYSDFALEGFNLGVTDYLLKPIPENRFEVAISKAKRSLLVENLDRFIFFRINGLNTKFLFNDILFFESAGNYIKIHTDQKTYLTIGTLTELETQLAKKYFLRIHKSFTINTKFLKQSISKTSIFIGTQELPIGRTYKADVLKMMEE